MTSDRDRAPTREQLEADVATMIAALKESEIFGPYGLTFIDRDGRLVEYFATERDVEEAKRRRGASFSPDVAIVLEDFEP